VQGSGAFAELSQGLTKDLQAMMQIPDRALFYGTLGKTITIPFMPKSS
jgi:hypothetical protein